MVSSIRCSLLINYYTISTRAQSSKQLDLMRTHLMWGSRHYIAVLHIIKDNLSLHHETPRDATRTRWDTGCHYNQHHLLWYKWLSSPITCYSGTFYNTSFIRAHIILWQHTHYVMTTSTHTIQMNQIQIKFLSTHLTDTYIII